MLTRAPGQQGPRPGADRAQPALWMRRCKAASGTSLAGRCPRRRLPPGFRQLDPFAAGARWLDPGPAVPGVSRVVFAASGRRKGKEAGRLRWACRGQPVRSGPRRLTCGPGPPPALLGSPPPARLASTAPPGQCPFCLHGLCALRRSRCNVSGAGGSARQSRRSAVCPAGGREAGVRAAPGGAAMAARLGALAASGLYLRRRHQQSPPAAAPG